MKFGIDVSEHQGEIQWEQVRSRIDFAIVRLGYGKGTWDTRAKQNLKAMEELQIPYGVYWFSYAYTKEMAEREAETVLEYLKEAGAKPVYPVYFDWEYDSRDWAKKQGVSVDGALLRQMADSFCRVIEAGGYPAGVYANDDYVAHHYGKDYFRQLTHTWYCWPGNCRSYDAKLWQYGQEQIPGISGKVDVNYSYHDYIKGREDGRFQSLDQVPDYGKTTIQKLLQKDLLEGTENGLDLTEDMVRILVILDRAGAFL